MAWQVPDDAAEAEARALGQSPTVSEACNRGVRASIPRDSHCQVHSMHAAWQVAACKGGLAGHTVTCATSVSMYHPGTQYA